MTHYGHNSGELDRLAQKAKRGLEVVAKGEEHTIEGWLFYGTALNDARATFPKGDNKRFSEWLATCNLQLEGPTAANDRAAAMWAAKDLDRFNEVREAYPRVRTVRGLHAKWKKSSVEEQVRQLMAPLYLADEASAEVLSFWQHQNNSNRVVEWINRDAPNQDAYHYAGLALRTFWLIEQDQEASLKDGDVERYERLETYKQTCADAVLLPVNKTKVLAALFFNEKANREGLKAGGRSVHHPLWSAYQQLFQRSGYAEEWCCEAMFEQALRDDPEGVHFHELMGLKTKRSPFWYLGIAAAEAVKQAA